MRKGKKMMKRIAIIGLAILFSGAMFVNAQNTAKGEKTTCHETIAKGEAHPVWKAINAQYAKLAAAMRKKRHRCHGRVVRAGLSRGDAYRRGLEPRAELGVSEKRACAGQGNFLYQQHDSSISRLRNELISLPINT
jgi:hypothetical protein